MNSLAQTPLDSVLSRHPVVEDFLTSLGLQAAGSETLYDWLAHLPDEALLDAGMEREQMLAHIQRLLEGLATSTGAKVSSLTLLGGRDKFGAPESIELTIRAGEVLCVVGPTGSGKSRLLADIECLAQADTPTGRRILINGDAPDSAMRYVPELKLVAQISQNMNFVVDLAVSEFVYLHACCRQVSQPEALTQQVIDCANALTGEKFNGSQSVTQLSGGQARALMIADAALLSTSPVVLIDEIENAGVDRKRALQLLAGGDKIVVISTHDPLLALRGNRRLVIRNGGIGEIITTSAAERRNLQHIEALDARLMEIRERLRQGLRIEETFTWLN